jgi:transcriptional antiterminator
LKKSLRAVDQDLQKCRSALTDDEVQLDDIPGNLALLTSIKDAINALMHQLQQSHPMGGTAPGAPVL